MSEIVSKIVQKEKGDTVAFAGDTLTFSRSGKYLLTYTDGFLTAVHQLPDTLPAESTCPQESLKKDDVAGLPFDL